MKDKTKSKQSVIDQAACDRRFPFIERINQTEVILLNRTCGNAGFRPNTG